MNSISKERLEAAIAQIDAGLAAEPHDVALQFDRAQFLELLGCTDAAMRGYNSVLECDGCHVEALTALGLLHLGCGDPQSARTLLKEAVQRGPAHAVAHANLAYACFLDNRLTDARVLYERALLLEPELAGAHHGLAELLAHTGDEVEAARHRARGLQYRPITINRYIGAGRPVHVLALETARLGNIVTDVFFDNRVFLVASLTVEYADPTVPLPPHDIVFNAIGEADLCADPLATAAAIVRRTDAPVLNSPHAVAATSRAANARRLRLLDGVVTPRTVLLARSALTGGDAQAVLAQHGFVYPLLVRSPGYHTGDHFVKIERAHDLEAAIALLPGNELLIIEYLDVRDRSGNSSKYRVIVVDGALYPLHLAISRRWKVHYFNADMTDRTEHRERDAAFLTDMHAALGASAIAALDRVRTMLGLDYGGIDFALDAAGNVIVFEANASMIVPQPAADPIWDYRRGPVARIHAAMRDMLVQRSGNLARVNVDG